MAEPHVVSALVKKRADLAGEIETLHQRITKLVSDVEAIDRSLLVFAPHIETKTISPRFRPPADWSKRGEMTRIVLGLLRLATEPLTTRDIAMQLIAQRGLDQSDKKLLRLMTRRVGAALRHQRDRGVVRSFPGPGQFVFWEMSASK